MTPKRPEATCFIALFFESPFGKRDVALLVFAAFAGVRGRAEAVHRDRHGLVRLLADGAEGHGGGDEPLDDGVRRLDLVKGNGRRFLEGKQPAKRAQVAASSLMTPEYCLYSA